MIDEVVFGQGATGRSWVTSHAGIQVCHQYIISVDYVDPYVPRLQGMYYCVYFRVVIRFAVAGVVEVVASMGQQPHYCHQDDQASRFFV